MGDRCGLHRGPQCCQAPAPCTPRAPEAGGSRGALLDWFGWGPGLGVLGAYAQRNDRIHAVTELVEGQTPSTKSAKAFLSTLTDRRQVLVVIGRADETSTLSVRNLPGVHVISPDQLNTYDVLKADDVVFSVEALNAYIEANNKSEVSA